MFDQYRGLSISIYLFTKLAQYPVQRRFYNKSDDLYIEWKPDVGGFIQCLISLLLLEKLTKQESDFFFKKMLITTRWSLDIYPRSNHLPYLCIRAPTFSG